MKKCEHKFEYRSEDVSLNDVNKGWFPAKRVIVFCINCGKVSHEQTNGNSSF